MACAAWAGHGVLRATSASNGALDTGLAFAFTVLVFAGMWTTSRARTVQARIRVLLDACTATTAVCALTCAAGLSPGEAATVDAGPSLLLRAVLPLLLATYYLTVMVTEIPFRRWGMFLLLSGAMLAAETAENLSVAALVTGRTTDVAVHLGWLTCFALMTASALVYRGTSVRRSTPPSSWLVTLAPFVLVVPAAAGLSVEQLVQGRLDGTSAAAAVCLVALVLARQLIIALENRRLLSRLAASEVALRHRADHDALTGSPNRSLLLERLATAVQSGPVGVLLIDLDGFKAVNDELGHEVGDALLVEVARRLREGLRTGDTSARLGGDEFAVVVPGPQIDACELADRLLLELSRPYALGGVGVDRVGASIGTAWQSQPRGSEGGDGGDGVDDLLRRADAAMYSAKRSGGSRSAPAPDRSVRPA